MMCSAIATAQPLLQWDSVGEPAAKKKVLTPEERAARKQQKDMMENELRIKRYQNFGTIPAEDQSQLALEYEKAFQAFRAAMTELDQVQHRQQLATEFTKEVEESITTGWTTSIANASAAYQDWLGKAGVVYASDPDKYVSIGESLREMLLYDVERDRFEGWLEPAKALVNADKLDNDEVLIAAGLVGYASNDFDFAEQCWMPLMESGTLPTMGAHFLGEFASLREKWARELEIRKAEAIRDDNPRVEFITSKGRIVVELYEDSAPEAVKSFIYLVEQNYFERLPFYRVVQHLCVQTGCEKGDGSGNAGYTIPGEAELPNHRDHFRGCLSVALGRLPETERMDVNSGGAQFFFPHIPKPEYDGTYTVFGRIIEGQSSISMFRAMDLSDDKQRKDTTLRPDIIQSVKVIRKRDHEYRPKVFVGRLPR
jgi:cyclophilin family peptidyl-prolyl cis-trans isomerase